MVEKGGLGPEKLTIDVNIARDCLDETRPHHRHAHDLLRLARDGLVNIEVAPQGYRTDVPGGELEKQLRALFDSEGIADAPQIARPSDVTYPSETFFPGAHIDGLVEAWEDVLATWKSHECREPEPQDRWHVETHLVANRDVFLTHDQPLLVMCQRLASEHGLPIRAMSTADYLEGRKRPPSRA